MTCNDEITFLSDSQRVTLLECSGVSDGMAFRIHVPSHGWNLLPILRGDVSPYEHLWDAEYGDSETDFMPVSNGCLIVMSHKAVKRLTKYSFSGVTFCEIPLAATTLERLSGPVYLPQITGRCGPLQPIDPRSVEVDRSGGLVTYTWRGIRVDPSSWDGSDWFLAPDGCEILVRRRVADAIDAEELTNVVCRQLDEIDYDESKVE